MAKRVLIIDCQVLQSSSVDRGMGKYSISLVSSLVDVDFYQEFDNVAFLLNNQLPTERAQGLLKPILEKVSNSKVIFLDKNYDKATRDNFEALQISLDELINSEYPKCKIAYFILSNFELYQSISTFPTTAFRGLLFYDLIPLIFPKLYLEDKSFKNEYFGRFKTIFDAHQIFSISQTSKNDLVEYLNISPKVISNIAGGPIDNGQIKSKPEVNLTKPYILFPSGNDWRKNNPKTIKSFVKWNIENDRAYHLVISSNIPENEQLVFADGDPDVIFTGYVSNEELNWLYDNSAGVVFSSLYEGLGLPILEAMSWKKPLLLSEIPAFLEFDETNLLFCNPKDSTSIQNGFAKLVSLKVDSRTYTRMLKTFSWSNTAKSFSTGFLKGVNGLKFEVNGKPTLALFGPDPAGYSAIGKFCQELMPVLSEKFDVTYIFERSKVSRPIKHTYLSYVWKSIPIEEYTPNERFDNYLYHIGNSEFHVATYFNALINPGTVILHDIDLRGLYSLIESRFPSWSSRSSIELDLEKIIQGFKPASNVARLLSSNEVVVHNDFGYNRLNDLKMKHNLQKSLSKAKLPISYSEISISKNRHKPVLLLAGIISGEKYFDEFINNIHILSDTYQIKISGYALDIVLKNELARLNEEKIIEFYPDCTDYEFSQVFKSSDILINLRPNYRGEASRTVLEALRYGLLPIVSNVGWFAELPDEIVIKIDSTEKLLPLLLDPSKKIFRLLELKKRSGALKDFLKSSSFDNYISSIFHY